MARLRKPTAILRLVGSFQKHPDRTRARAGEPDPVDGVGEPPEYFSPAVRAAWREIATTAHAGVLCRADRLALEIAARLLVQYRRSPVEFPEARLLRLNVLLGQFGMTPADRSRVSAHGAAGNAPNRFNRFAELLASRRAGRSR